ncbi:MAG: CBS domain-containing protein [Pirellulales bacterium]
MIFGTQTQRRRTQRTRRGATVVEYVTFTALVAGVVIVGLEQIAPSTSGTYTTVSRQLGERGPSTSSKTAPLVAAGSPETAQPSPRDRLVWQVPVLAGLGLLWSLLVLRRHQSSKEGGELAIDIEQVSDRNSDARLFAKRQQILATLINDVRALSSGEVAVRHVMSSRLTSVESSTGVEEIRELMAEKKLRHMLVCDGGRLLGIISDRDLSAKKGRAAADYMTPSPLSVPSDTLLSPAVTLMMRKRISCLPVVDEGKLCGLFTTTDLIMTLQCAFQLLEKVAPQLADQAKTAKSISLRDSFTGLGEFAGETKRPQAPAAKASADSTDDASGQDYVSVGSPDATERGEAEPFVEDVDAVETHAAH